MSRVVLHDATLRDGQHAVRHQLDAAQLTAYASAAEAAGVAVVEVGHGNGLGASSLQIGHALLDDAQMLTTVRACLHRTRLGVFAAPGWATSDDLRAAADLGADVVRIATHCTEADVTQQLLELARVLGLEAHAVLLMSHMATPAKLADQAALLTSFGAQAVGIMDSAGHFLPGDVQDRIAAMVTAVEVSVLFHAHDNLGMAVANSLAAVEAGASILDGCARGFGAGAGNAPIEVLAGVLDRLGYETGIDLYRMLDAADIVAGQLMHTAPAIDSLSLVSGLAGVFSGFKPEVLRLALEHGVDGRDVFFELGRRQAVAGQEDLILDVVRDLAAGRSAEAVMSA